MRSAFNEAGVFFATGKAFGFLHQPALRFLPRWIYSELTKADGIPRDCRIFHHDDSWLVRCLRMRTDARLEPATRSIQTMLFSFP